MKETRGFMTVESVFVCDSCRKEIKTKKKVYEFCLSKDGSTFTFCCDCIKTFIKLFDDLRTK